MSHCSDVLHLSDLYPLTSLGSLSLGAAKVGKTSLIMSLVSEEFPDVVRINNYHVEKI